MAITEILNGFARVEGSVLRVDDVREQPLAIVDPCDFQLEVTAGGSLRLIVVHTAPHESHLELRVEKNARLELTEIFAADARSYVHMLQGEDSYASVTAVQVGASQANYLMDLNGHGAENRTDGVFLVGGEEHSVMKLRTNHNVPLCTSRGYVKGIAGGHSVGEFHGLVYVAFDAQRTDAEQQSRNILMSDAARIVTKPQLEIYADDVKCNHGATVGQMDSEAIYYMRQRGLSEMDARRLQIEGFVADVLRHCGDENLAMSLMGVVAEKMQRI